MKPKLLYVIDNLEFGGGERGFAQLATALRDRYEIQFACQPGGLLGERLKSLGVPIRPLDFRRQLSFSRVARLVGIIRAERVRLIHSMGARADFAVRVAGRLARTPVIVSTIAMFVEGYEVRPVTRAVYRTAIRFSERLADGFIAVSDSVGRTLVQDHRIPAAKVVRIYSGVELEAFQPGDRDGFRVKRELGFDPEAPLVGTIGRMVHQKAHDVFLQAASLVTKAVPDVQFLIAGEGPLRPGLEVLSRELGLRNCRFVGFREDIPSMLSIMDVFVLSSVLEGLPRVVLEALAMARPVVATRLDGVTEVIQDGLTGLLVPLRDPATLADAVISLLKDPGQARRLGQAGRKLVEERFAVRWMVEEVDRFYTTLLEKKGIR